MSDSTIEPTPVAESDDEITRRRITWLTLAIAALFGLVFANFVYQAIRNLLELPKLYDAIGLSESVPWALLVIGLAIPILLYVAAFLLAFHRSYLSQVVIFAMSLTVTAGLGFTVVAIHRLSFLALGS